VTPPSSLRAAAVQLTSTDDTARNVETAERLVGRAAAAGAQLVVLPEKWPFLQTGARLLLGAEALDGPSISAAREWARRWGIALLAGSVTERTPEGRRTYNTSVLVQPDGECSDVYRKIHLFDVEVGGVVYRESDTTLPGEVPVLAETLGRRIGMSVCYDLRFPELYRAYAEAGAEVLAVPAAFTVETGRDHWEPLLRARAIENQAFVVAANQVGVHAEGLRSYGRSMIVDPWGVVLAQAQDDETVVVADLDMAYLHRVRAGLPALAHRRPEAYSANAASPGGSSGSA